MDETKKPGARDISDLKARLGLKKPGATAAVTPPPGAPQAQPLPAPPGVASASPTSFGSSDPRRDPFAQQAQAQAAQLAAYYGIGQVLPGSADTTNDAPIAKPKPWGRIALGAGLGAAVFIVGIAAGSVSADRSAFNEAIDQSQGIREEVEQLAKQLASVTQALRQSRVSPDVELAERLGQLSLKKPDPQKLFHVNYSHFESLAVERLFTYYNDTIALYDSIAQHAHQTAAEKETIVKFVSDQSKNGKKYGVVLNLAGLIPTAKFAEIGRGACAKAGVAPNECNVNDLRAEYRLDTSANWTLRPVNGKPEQTVIAIDASPLFQAATVGNPALLASEACKRRTQTIAKEVEKLLGEQKEVLADLKHAAERPRLLAF